MGMHSAKMAQPTKQAGVLVIVFFSFTSFFLVMIWQFLFANFLPKTEKDLKRAF